MSIAEQLVNKTPMMVTHGSPAEAMAANMKAQNEANVAQAKTNATIGGRRRRRRRRKNHTQKGGAAEKGITIPQSSSDEANTGIKQNFTAIVNAGEQATTDTPPQVADTQVGGKRKRKCKCKHKSKCKHKCKCKHTHKKKKRRRKSRKTKRKRKKKRRKTKKHRKRRNRA